MPEFWMCPMQYITSGLCTYYWASMEAKMNLEHCQPFKMQCFSKRIMSECGWICINIPDSLKYPWKYFNKLFWICLIILHVWKTFEYGSVSKLSHVCGWKCVPTAICGYFWGPWVSFLTTDEFSMRVTKTASRIGVSWTDSLPFYF